MNTNSLPPTAEHDPVDRLLSDYFHHQLPKTWPAAPQPWASSVLSVAPTTTDPMFKSRLALAASVALLLGGCWYLSGNLSNGKKSTQVDLTGGEASTKVLKDMNKKKANTP